MQPLSPTWLLFASGNSVKVEISLYDPAAVRSRPIEAYMVSDVGSDLARSASRAAETVYAVAHAAQIAPPPTVVGYDLQGLGNGIEISGQSSGLALALALAKKIWPDADPGPLAATGEIAGSSNGGPLNKIAGIQAKGESLLSLMPDGGYFFYPKSNDPEISQELKESWRANGIKAHAVATVAEALALFIPEISEKSVGQPEQAASIMVPKKRSHPGPLIFISFFSLVAFAAGLIYTTQQPRLKPKSPAPQIVSANKSPAQPAASISAPPATEKVSPKAQLSDQIASQTNSKSGPGASASPPELSTPAGKITQSIPLPGNFPAITLTGASGLASRLARRTQTRLQAFIDSEKELRQELKQLSGRIEMLEIRERWDPQTEILSSTVTSAFHGQVTLNDSEPHKIDLEPITVSGTDSMRRQLTNAATLMVERITKSLLKRDGFKSNKISTPVPSMSEGAQGFE